MINRSVRPATLLSATARRLPGVSWALGRCAGNTRSPEYCYGVWMRHLVRTSRYADVRAPGLVAELGPGPSLGTALAALLSGADQAYALDVSAHADSQACNLQVLERLIELFARRAAIPGPSVLGDVRPSLEDYRFPAHVLPDAVLERALVPERIQRIRDALSGRDSMIRYAAPWGEAGIVAPGTVDLIFSQAVLEHVDDLVELYRNCHIWLRPGGLMSHQIDFRCHGTARHWNGHWTYSDALWWFVSSARPYLINREPCSTHLRLLREQGFEVLRQETYSAPSRLSRSDLAPRFRGLGEEDLTTTGVYLLARRMG